MSHCSRLHSSNSSKDNLIRFRTVLWFTWSDFSRIPPDPFITLCFPAAGGSTLVYKCQVSWWVHVLMSRTWFWMQGSYGPVVAHKHKSCCWLDCWLQIGFVVFDIKLQMNERLSFWLLKVGKVLIHQSIFFIVYYFKINISVIQIDPRPVCQVFTFALELTWIYQSQALLAP